MRCICLWLGFGLGPILGQKFSCTQTSDTKGLGLQVLQTPNTNTDFCSNMANTDTVEELVDTCGAFCGNGNIPLLVGIPSYGFNHADIDSVCLAADNTLAQYNPTLMSTCRTSANSLQLIQTRAAALVAALDNMTLAQLTFKAGIALKSQELATTMSSQTTRDALLSATDSQLVGQYRAILEAGVSDFLSNGKYRRDLQDTMEVLRNAGRDLDATLTTNIPQLTTFVEQCGELLVSTGAANEYMLDICVQRAAVCLDNAEAQHIGCCCSTIPLSGTFSVSGERDDSIPTVTVTTTTATTANTTPAPTTTTTMTTTPAARRLQTSQTPVDICAEAEVMFKTDRASRETELKSSSEGDALLQAYLTQLRTAYPNFYTTNGCRTRRLEESKLETDVQPPQQTEAKPPVKGAEHAEPRQLKLTGCSPQRATQTDTSLKAAFWVQTEENFCVDVPTGTAGTAMTDLGLTDICKSFCGNDAVPLTIGGINFGFNQSTMDGICLGGEIIEANASFVSTCHAHARAMNDVQIKLAAFVASLSVLEAEKTLFQANAKKLAADLKAAIAARAASVLQDATVDQKIVKLKELLVQETSAMKTSGTAYLAIKRAMQDVELKGNQLKTTLSQSLGALDTLVTDCNKLFTGVGSSSEYLLDLCSQTSTACMDVELGRHAGCCCGYSPLIALGSSVVPTATIDGLSNARFSADTTGLTRTALRRLAGNPYDVCGEADKASRPLVDQAETQVKALGQEALIQQHLQDLARQYPDQFGCHLPGCQADTGGTCSIFGCSSSRGTTDCVNGKCQCRSGECANSEGRCVSAADFAGGGLKDQADELGGTDAGIALHFSPLVGLVLLGLSKLW